VLCGGVRRRRGGERREVEERDEKEEKERIGFLICIWRRLF
jgi:hypothetical protein